MNLDPFSRNGKNPFASGNKGKSSQDEIFIKSKSGGAGRRPVPSDMPEPMDMSAPEAASEPEKEVKSVTLSNPQWVGGKIGFNEEAEVSVELALPEAHAHKTRVTFELFGKTPKGPERISQGEGIAIDGKAVGRVPVYIPNYLDKDGNRLQKVEYFFLAKHSEADPWTAPNP